MKRIVIQDRYTETAWERKIGDGPWELQPLLAWHGKPPVLFINIDWSKTEYVIQNTIISDEK